MNRYGYFKILLKGLETNDFFPLFEGESVNYKIKQLFVQLQDFLLRKKPVKLN